MATYAFRPLLPLSQLFASTCHRLPLMAIVNSFSSQISCLQEANKTANMELENFQQILNAQSKVVEGISQQERDQLDSLVAILKDSHANGVMESVSAPAASNSIQSSLLLCFTSAQALIEKQQEQEVKQWGEDCVGMDVHGCARIGNHD